MTRHGPVAFQAEGKGCEFLGTNHCPSKKLKDSHCGWGAERDGKKDIRGRGRGWQEPDHAELFMVVLQAQVFFLLIMGSTEVLNTKVAQQVYNRYTG